MKQVRTKTRNSPRPPATMATVAARAGVSAMTVSRALKSDGAVSEETRRRILAAVEELGYVLDLSA
ncbi:MAG: LacI family DNA-binding transcriptional regulator, partial [Bradyrhizobium sp.]